MWRAHPRAPPSGRILQPGCPGEPPGPGSPAWEACAAVTQEWKFTRQNLPGAPVESVQLIVVLKLAVDVGHPVQNQPPVGGPHQPHGAHSTPHAHGGNPAGGEGSGPVGTHPPSGTSASPSGLPFTKHGPLMTTLQAQEVMQGDTRQRTPGCLRQGPHLCLCLRDSAPICFHTEICLRFYLKNSALKNKTQTSTQFDNELIFVAAAELRATQASGSQFTDEAQRGQITPQGQTAGGDWS